MNERKTGVDILGFGPIGRDLARKLVAPGSRFYVASISDSSITIYPKDGSQVLQAIKQKEETKKFKLSSLKEFKRGPEAETLQGVEYSGASIAVDVTNSDYRKPEEAGKRAEVALGAGKHFVSASKVALANYFSQILEQARKKELFIGFGATICGARHAIKVVESLPPGEVQSALGVLNASTTLILSTLEESRTLSFEDACSEATKNGILESDWSIDLDGLDAAAKTSIVANVLFPNIHVSINDVSRRGIRDKEASEMIESVKREAPQRKIRLVSEIENGKASVQPRILPSDSPLVVHGRFNVVSLVTANLGEISVKSLGGGVSLTSSILLSDINEAVGRKI
ncbi:MAG: hypothetical protein ACRECH_02530 [Nitrososphaerales archaeon]